MYSIITNKDDLTKETSRITDVLKESGYQESIISKILRRIANNHSLSQSQQQTQATNVHKKEIRINKNLPNGQGNSEKLQRFLKSHKIRSTLYTENTFHKLLGN